MRLDVTSTAVVNAAFTACAAEHGSLDILVNSAGLGQQLAPLTELADDEWDRVVDVTLRAANSSY
jgi:3-oxoacyl-[acyl-carrier protein] reductase